MPALSDPRYFRVSGRVQGVGFRAATRDTARQLGLQGWVRNRADGDVELVAAGPEAALTQLRDWLAQGPAMARVTRVDEHESNDHSLPARFDIR